MPVAVIVIGALLILVGVIAAFGFWPVALVLLGVLVVGFGIASNEDRRP